MVNILLSLLLAAVVFFSCILGEETAACDVGDGNGDGTATRLLWSTPLRISDNAIDARTQDGLVAMAEYLEATYNTNHYSNRGGWQSHNIMTTELEVKDPNVVNLLGAIRRETARFLKRGANPSGGPSATTIAKLENGELEVSVPSLWLNINGPHHHNVLHQHGDSLISGVVYLSTASATNGGGEIVFTDPRPQAFARSHYADFFGMQRNEYIVPRNRTMLLFPSWQPHRVEPFVGDHASRRISAAFNIALGKANRVFAQ